LSTAEEGSIHITVSIRLKFAPGYNQGPFRD